MIRYRVFDNFEASCIVKKRGFAPEDTYTNTTYFFDLSAVLALQFEDRMLKTIEIESTDTWPFSQSWFDEQRANSSNDLPNTPAVAPSRFGDLRTVYLPSKRKGPRPRMRLRAFAYADREERPRGLAWRLFSAEDYRFARKRPCRLQCQ